MEYLVFLNKNICLAAFLMASVSFVESSSGRKDSSSSDDNSMYGGSVAPSQLSQGGTSEVELPSISSKQTSPTGSSSPGISLEGSRRSSDDAVIDQSFDHNAIWAQAFASQKSHQHVQAAEHFLALMDFAIKNPKYAPLFSKLYEGAKFNLDASLQKDH